MLSSIFSTQSNSTKITISATTFIAIYTFLRKKGISSSSAYLVLQNVISKLAKALESNQFLQAIVYPSAIGFVYYAFQTYVWNEVRARFRSLFYSSLTISSKDENFKAILDYVTKCAYKNNPLSSALAETKKKKHDRKSWRRRWNGIGERSPPELEYRPYGFINRVL